MLGPVWAVGSIENECNTEQSSDGLLLFSGSRTAPHRAFVVSHLEINTIMRAL